MSDIPSAESVSSLLSVIGRKTEQLDMALDALDVLKGHVFALLAALEHFGDDDVPPCFCEHIPCGDSPACVETRAAIAKAKGVA